MRVVLGIVAGLVLACLGIVQLASDAFTARVASPQSLPRHIPIGFALRVYGVLDRIAPAPYVETTLAEYEMDRGDLHAAALHALRLPRSPIRNELLGRIAQRQGDASRAFEYFFAAPDIVALRENVERIAKHDPAHAYAVESRIRERLQALRTHPDAVADASWMMARFAEAAAARSSPALRVMWLRRALRNASAAAALSPLSEKYLLVTAGAELRLGDVEAARRWYHRVLAVDPRNSKALAALARLDGTRKR